VENPVTKKIRTLFAVIAFALATILAGCTATQTPPNAYVKADRATLNAMKPIGDIAKEAQPFLANDIDQKFESWERRVADAEQGNFHE
jgi:PBP1b-binding outer membrane lipoprotein LpoB